MADIMEINEAELFQKYIDGGSDICPVCERKDCVEWDDIDLDTYSRKFYCSNCNLIFYELLEITNVALSQL